MDSNSAYSRFISVWRHVIKAIGMPRAERMKVMAEIELYLQELETDSLKVDDLPLIVSSGPVGKSVFEIWLDAGHVGNVEDFLNYMRGGNASMSDITAAVSAWMQEHPQVATASEALLEQGLASYFQKHPPIQGPIGLTGAAGAIGPQGPKGDVGATGPAGPAGLTGPAGPAGPAGATGAAGPVGPKGDKGDPGLAGTIGLTGPMGVKGDKGDTGAQGPAGPAGATGATGATGAPGAKGDTGATGAKGDVGAQGPKGDTGDKGEAGAGVSFVAFATIGETATVAITAGVRKVTVDCAGAVKGGRYSFHPQSYRLNGAAAVDGEPANYTCHNAVCNTAGKITVSLSVPALAIGAAYAISGDVMKLGL